MKEPKKKKLKKTSLLLFAPARIARCVGYAAPYWRVVR